MEHLVYRQHRGGGVSGEALRKGLSAKCVSTAIFNYDFETPFLNRFF
jgi:hypothetical protein